MSAYRDIFGKKLKKQDVVQAVIHTVRTRSTSSYNLARGMGVGFFKASRLTRLLVDAGVTTATGYILLKEDAAVNAALRQLKKGRK